MTTQDDYKVFLHTPAESTSNYVKWVERLQDAPKLDYGCILDKHLIPLHPGDLMAVVARPGHGKSSFMAYMAKRAAKQIAERGEKDKCVIYVSWEQSVEEIEAFFQSGEYYNSTDLAWGRVDMQTVKERSIKRIKLPIWLMGYSVGKTDEVRPPMTIDRVYKAIRDVRYEYKFEPVLICLDYLQNIPVPKVSERTAQVTEATIKAKHLAMEVGVPIIAGVQARREAERGKMHMPSMADAQWSSAIEQTADKQISLFRPIKVMEEGEVMDVGNHQYEIDEKLLLIKLLKQRFDVGYGIWGVRFEPQTLTMYDHVFHPMNGAQRQ